MSKKPLPDGDEEQLDNSPKRNNFNKGSSKTFASNKTYKTAPEHEENPLLADYDPFKYVTRRKKYMCYP